MEQYLYGNEIWDYLMLIFFSYASFSSLSVVLSVARMHTIGTNIWVVGVERSRADGERETLLLMMM